MWSYYKRKSPNTVDFECVECDYIEHADVVGALNVLERGEQSSMPKNVKVGYFRRVYKVNYVISSLRQEPTEYPIACDGS